MSRDDITDAAICKTVASVLPPRISKSGVTPEMTLRQQLDIDSIGLLSIVFALEESFSVELAPFGDRLVDAVSIADIIAVVMTAAKAK